MASKMLSIISIILCCGAGLALKGGTIVDPCDYPGMATITSAANDALLCSGVIHGQEVLLPHLCEGVLSQLSEALDIIVHYADGSKNFTIKRGELSSTTVGGILRVDVTNNGFTSEGCFVDSTLYDQSVMSLNLSSCELVAYGGNVSDTYIYNKVLSSIAVTRSTSAPCCYTVRDAMTSDQQGIILDQSAPFNCFASEGSPCGFGDLGGPVYCMDQMTGLLVVTALTSSMPCQSGSPFMAHDLTNEDVNFKFGLYYY